jgi:murein DD-endopeptidase MepM/ murein hydrolase activator NlpD
MTRPTTLIGLLLAGLAALALLAPAASPAEEVAQPTTGGETTTTSTAPVTTATAPAPEATTPANTAPTTSATTESTPAPATPTTGEPAAPQISRQSAQGASPSRPAGSGDGRDKSKAGGRGEKSAANGGPAAKLKRGKRAPKPSALTPPLPLSLSSSIAGVPAFFIESFRIPPFLLPIFQAAGTAYGVPWQVLAAINEVETDYGRDLSVSTAGAEGWMQFLPSSWATYAVDANGDGFKDPYNPADAIFAAARYLRAAGAATSLRGAVFSYNHSQAYVESVMLRAKLLGGTPSGLLGAITGLTEARFPVHAKAHFSDGFPTAPADGSGADKQIPGTTIYSEAGAPVIAVQDGQVVQIGDSPQLGRFVSLRDAYGNTYTYAKLGSVAQLYPVLKPHDAQGAAAPSQKAEPVEPRPTGPASAGTQAHSQPPGGEGAATSALSLGSSSALEAAAPGSTVTPQPDASSAPQQSPAPTTSGASTTAGGEGVGPSGSPEAPAAGSAPETSSSATPRVFRDGPNDVYLHELHTGARVIAGTVLGHVGDGEGGGGEASEPHMLFQIRPAGVGAPQIDPKPILDGWVQLENSSVFRAKGQNPFLATAPTVGQVLLESKEQLQQQVLANPDIDIYPCGRQDIQTGQIDRRVLATLEFLAVSGLKPTVSALKCGHSDLTSEGNVSEHSTGDAVDISQINGIPIAGHQGPGSITDTTIRKLLTLQGSMEPHQIISLMTYPGADNTLARADHYNHIHVGFRPLFAQSASLAGSLSSSITPSQWIKLIARLGEIPDPTVSSGPSAAAIPVHADTASGGGR